jgi:hypothetical protein
MRKLTLLFASFALCGALVPTAFAATDGPYTTSTPIPSTTTDWVSSLAFQQFNPALGTLTAVEVDLHGSFDSTITVTNTSADPSSGTARTDVQFTAQDGGLNLAPTPQIDLLSGTYAYSLPGGGNVTSPLISTSTSSGSTYTAAPILAEFTGVGTFALGASTFTQTVLSNTGGNTTASQVTSAALTGSVTYFYTPVPEPSTVALLGLGMASVLAFARRRRSA